MKNLCSLDDKPSIQEIDDKRYDQRDSRTGAKHHVVTKTVFEKRDEGIGV